MSTPFNDVYDKFFLGLGDDAKLKLLKLQILDLEELLYSMLEESIVSFKRCKKPLEEKLNKKDSMFDDIDLDLEEKSILGLGMVLIWIRPQVRRLQHTRQSIGDRDFKLSSNWQTLNSLNALKSDTETELKQKITSYTYNNLSDIPIKK